MHDTPALPVPLARTTARTAFARLCRRLGLARTADAAARAEQIGRRLERHDKRLERVHEILDQQAQQASSVRVTVDDLAASVATLQQAMAVVTGRASLLALARKQDLGSLDAVRALIDRLEQQAAPVSAHVTRALSSAVVASDPFPHVVVDGLFPDDFYDEALAALPPADYWQSGGRARDYWEIGTDVAPWATETVWNFVDRRIVDGVIRSALVAAFDRHLGELWREVWGLDPASVSYRAAEGRLQRRRRGYLLRPHLDPPHAALTALFYLARTGDDPRHGTRLYRPTAALPPRRQGIFYPEDHGIPLEHTATVPFRANTLLVWMTSLGPHGADLTSPDTPKSLERFTYQFQIVVDDAVRARLKSTERSS